MYVNHFSRWLGALTLLHVGFKVLSEAERTAALYSLLQHSTQVQIRFFITVLQQMARSDPMTALLSPAIGGKSSVRLIYPYHALPMPIFSWHPPSIPSNPNLIR